MSVYAYTQWPQKQYLYSCFIIDFLLGNKDAKKLFDNYKDAVGCRNDERNRLQKDTDKKHKALLEYKRN